MGLLQYENVKIAGISVCVPEQVVENVAFGQNIFGNEELQKTIDSIGVNYRHVAPAGLCTSDLWHSLVRTLHRVLAERRKPDPHGSTAGDG